MDRACAVERAAVNHENCTSLDSRWKEEDRENLENNGRERDERHAANSRITDETGPGKVEVETLCCCPRCHGVKRPMIYQ